MHEFSICIVKLYSGLPQRRHGSVEKNTIITWPYHAPKTGYCVMIYRRDAIKIHDLSWLNFTGFSIRYMAQYRQLFWFLFQPICSIFQKQCDWFKKNN